MKLNTVSEVRAFLRGTLAKAKHHATVLLPLLGPLLLALLVTAEDGTLSALPGKDGEPSGAQIRFGYRGLKFKLKSIHSPRSIVLQQVLGVREGPVLAQFYPEDDPTTFERTLQRALKEAA